MTSEPWEGPLFLIGMPRSGTKLLRNLLSGHPKLSILPWETEFLPFLSAWVERNGAPRDERSFERLASAIAPALYFDYRRKERGAFSWPEWREACRGRFDAADLFEGFARAELSLARGSGTIWGDKSPCYIEHVGLIRHIFPEAKLIHIVRDVRDYCLSLRGFGKDMRRAAHRWNAGVLGMHRLQASGADGVMSIHFEALVTDTAAQLARLCEFLGLRYADEMLALDKPVENHGTAKGQKGIISSNLGRYRQELGARDLRAIEAIAWDGMQAMGYEPQLAEGRRELASATLKLLKVKDGLSLIAKDVEGRGLIRSAAAYVGDYRIKRQSEARP